MINILITSSSTVTALNVFRALKQRKDVKLYSTDIRREASSLVYTDKHFVVPHASNENYINRLFNICLENKIKYVFPISDAECKKLSDAAEIFLECGTNILVSNPDVIGITCNKLKTSNYFKSIGIKTPETWMLNDKSVIKYPAVLRTNIAGIGKKSVNIIEDIVDLEYYSKKVKGELVLSKFIKGSEFTIDTLSDSSGSVLEVIPRQRTYVLNGNTKIGTVVKNKKMIEEVKLIVETLGIKGIACVQCINSDTGNYYFEINPRVGSGLDLTVNAGANLPSLLIDTYEKNYSKKFHSNITYGLKMVRYEDCHIIDF